MLYRSYLIVSDFQFPRGHPHHLNVLAIEAIGVRSHNTHLLNSLLDRPQQGRVDAHVGRNVVCCRSTTELRQGARVVAEFSQFPDRLGMTNLEVTQTLDWKIENVTSLTILANKFRLSIKILVEVRKVRKSENKSENGQSKIKVQNLSKLYSYSFQGDL